MGNMFDRAHRLHFFSLRLLFFRHLRPMAEAPIAIEITEEDRSEVDGMTTFVGLADAHRLAHQSLTQKHLLAEPFDFAIAAHTTNQMIGRILRLPQTSGVDAPRR